MTPSNDTPAETCPCCGKRVYWHNRKAHEAGHCMKDNTPAAPVGSQEQRKVSDYDIWYQPCAHCGFDTGKSSTEQTRCWKCGRNIHRDFSGRALKKL